MALKMTQDDLSAFLHGEFTQFADDFEFVEITEAHVIMALSSDNRHLRPGGTVSGPSMFSLADVGAYFRIMSLLGPVALAVTTNCSIDFMRKPAPGRLLCKTVALKMGRSLAVTDGRIYTEGAEDKPVARASLTYSIPPSSNGR